MPVLLRSRLRTTPLRLPAVERMMQHILSLVGHHDDLVSLDFVGDRRMQRLNRHYRRHDRTTDVLAFATREAGGPPSPLIGDIVISVPQAARQATAHGHSVSREIVVLLIHGVLHLLGYDHERGEREAYRMRLEEQRLLRALTPVPLLIGHSRSSGRHSHRARKAG